MHRADVVLSMPFALFLGDVRRFYSTAAAVNENNLLTDVVRIWDGALKLRDGMLALSCLDKRRTDLLKQVYMILESSTVPSRHHEEYDKP